MMAVTGADGFLAWHVRVRRRAQQQPEAVAVTRRTFESPERLAAALDGVDTIIHLAGVNRAANDEEVHVGNIQLAQKLAQALSAIGRPMHVVYGNSIQSRSDNPYGRGKRRAGKIIADAVGAAGGTFVDVVLPNIFGEHGRPAYNSFIATFCHEIANGGKPRVIQDRSVPLLHAQTAAALLIEAAARREDHEVAPAGSEHRVSAILARIVEYHDKYRSGQIPALPDDFSTNLFNTYRSYMFPHHFPFSAGVNADKRGELFETVRFHGGAGQTFVSTTVPGATRGDHFHLNKVERFFVIAGTADIALRRVYSDEVVRFRIEGRDRCFVDMPTMWVHNISNVGDRDLITMFWSDQLLDPESPDTYWEHVDAAEVQGED